MADVTVPEPLPLATIPGVELVRAGQWDISTGRITFTRDDLAAAVAALDCPAIRRPVLKLGHDEPDPENGKRWDGEPAIGYIDAMALADEGLTIVGDYVGMPGWLGTVMASAYPDRSIECYWDWPCQLGHVHPFVISAVALLGVVRPGVGTLQSLQDVAALYGVAAADDAGRGEPVTLTIRAAKEPVMPNPRPKKVAAGVTSEDVRRAYYDDAPWPEWICEMQLNPLQLIIVDDNSGKYYRVPVTVDGEDEFTFGDKVEVKIRYEDVPAAAAKTAAAAIVFASRAESRPGTAKAAVSDTAWSEFSKSDYDVAQWHRACLVHTHDGAAEDKGDCKLPVKEPSGTLNRNGVHAAAQRIGQLKGVDADTKKAAAKKLVALYRNQLKEDPPDSLLELAGESSSNASKAPPVTAAGPNGDQKEGAGMDPAKLREALGLSPEATDEQVRETLADSGVTRAPGEPPDDPPEDPETDPADPEPLIPPPPEPQQPAGLPEGVVTIDAAALGELRKQAADGAAARRQQQTEARDAAIKAAIGQGKIPPARREHWERLWNSDPDGTKSTLASLAAGTVPLEDVGAPGAAEDTSADNEFDRLFRRPGASLTSKEG